MGWWRDRPVWRAGWLTHRLLPLRPGLSPLLPVAHYLNQTLDFRQESVLLAWKKCHEGNKRFFCKKMAYLAQKTKIKCVGMHCYVCVWVVIATTAHVQRNSSMWNVIYEMFLIFKEKLFGSVWLWFSAFWFGLSRFYNWFKSCPYRQK